jgi:hypothetical protein
MADEMKANETKAEGPKVTPEDAAAAQVQATETAKTGSKRAKVKATLPEEGSLEEAAIVADPQTYEEQLVALLPADERTKPGAKLFAEACVAYGIDPDPNVRPMNVLHEVGQPRWRYVNARPEFREPERVRFVTGGGVKVVHPMDEDFEHRLKGHFKTTRMVSGKLVDVGLPANLTLPEPLVTGQVPEPQEQVVPGGFLKQAAQAAARRR